MNPFSYFDLLFCINLDSRPDRWEESKIEFSKMGVLDRIIRVPGVLHSKPFYCCHLSHAKCLEISLEKVADKILIFEDDVEFFPEAYENLTQAVIELPLDWDMFYLGANLDKYEAYQESEHIIRLTGAFSTHAYAVKNTLFNELLKINLDPEVGNNDVCFANIVHPIYNCFMTWPLVAGQRKNYSDIQKTVMESNNMFLERTKNNTVWLQK